MRLLRYFIFFLLLPMASSAEMLCKPVPYLEKEFNFDNYRTCHHRLSLCPHLNGTPYVDPACVKRTIQLNKFCRQLQSISNIIGTDPTFLTIKNYRGKIAIISVYYAADGARAYYILTPKKCLLKTAVDPRRLSTELKTRYKSFNFYTENNGEPKVKFNDDHSISISVPIKVTNTCRACDEILKANIQYNFSSSGSMLHATVKLGAVDNSAALSS